MAITDQPWRVTCLCPSARVDAAKAWYAAVVGEGEILMATYSASGADPAEFHGVSGVLTQEQMGSFLSALADGTSVPPPTNWAKWADTTQKNWLKKTFPTVLAETGYIAAVDDLREREWTWIAVILKANGLKQIAKEEP